MRVAVLIPGAKKGLQPVTFAAFLQALAAEVGEVVVWDVTLSRIEELRVGLGTFSPDRTRFRNRFNASPDAFRRRSQVVERLVAAETRPLDAVLQIGISFDAGAAAAQWPLVIYTDYSFVLTRDFGRPWRPELTEATISARVALERAAVGAAVRVCTRSAFVADALRREQGVDPARLSVVGAGPSITPPVRRDGPPRLLFFGNDFLRKGGDIVLAAFARLRLDFPWLEIDIVAPPAHRRRIAGVTWHTERSVAGIAGLLGRASILLMPSRFETWGEALVEAMAAGTVPVIADIAPMTEIVTHGVDGLLVPRDDPRALAETVAPLLRDPILLDRYSRAAALRVTRDLSQAAVVRRISRALRLAVEEHALTAESPRRRRPEPGPG